MADFENLPPELRDMVYHYLWLETPLIEMPPDWRCLKHTMDYLPKTREPDYDADGHEDIGQVEPTATPMENMIGEEVDSDSDSDEDSDDEFVVEWTEARRRQATGLPWGLPQWLLTNKAMLIEGLNTFDRRGLNTLEVSVFELPGETYPEVNEIKGKVYDSNLFSNLVAPFRARRLRLLVNQEVSDSYWMVTENLEMGEKEIEFCKGLFEDILYHQTTKELHFQPIPYRHDVGPVKIDLRALERLIEPLGHQLSRLEVRFRARLDDDMLEDDDPELTDGESAQDLVLKTLGRVFQAHVDMGSRALPSMRLNDHVIIRHNQQAESYINCRWRFGWIEVDSKRR